MTYHRIGLAGLAALLLLPYSTMALAQQAPAQQREASRPPASPAKEAGKPAGLGNLGGNTKEPIKIDADRLDVFDRENRAVFSGNVVAVQGESTIRCVTLTVVYDRGQQGTAKTPAAPPAGGQADNAIRQIDCAGKPDNPVTVVSKDQVATGDNAVFDRVANKVILTGNVALSQCQNVTRGEKIVYDLNTGVANVETAPGGRVKALFVPGGGEDKAKQGCQQPAPPATQAAQAKPAAKPPAPQRPQTN